METFNQDPKPGRLVLPLVLIGMIATTYTFVNRVATNNNLEVSVVEEEVTTEEYEVEKITAVAGVRGAEAEDEALHHLDYRKSMKGIDEGSLKNAL